ncbi:uncharacterized protein LOC123516246 [Portunus trituberculatus]|uniref:uncharacterized protein LOC123516246 n=1 Tax=Portunus trituberculatus TaxID=210409 RepID=UPI001E1CDF78|nr:uncharacterized protein LOC123516246 [Portunus trituberculatus]
MVKGQDATSHGRRWEENEGEGCNWSELVIRSRDCSDPVRPAPSGKVLWLRTAPTLTVAAAAAAAATATRRGTASHWAFTAVPLIRVAVAATGTEGLRLAAAWQTPATPPPLTPPPPPQSREIQLRIADILLFNACCHYHLIIVVSLYLKLGSVVTTE